MNRFILADLTSHKRGYGVKTAMDAVAHRVGTGSKVTWIIPSHLAAAFAGNPSTVIVDGPAPQVWDEIQRRADALKAEDSNTEILVVTWDQYIYDRALKAQGLNRTKWYNFLSEDRALRTTFVQHSATTTSLAGAAGISKGDM